jgi:hypothetical protein
MNTLQNKKKTWIKPVIIVLNIRKDTFGSSPTSGPEGANKSFPKKF